MAEVSNTSVWLKAFRLHTLPLAVASIALGNFLAYSAGYFHPVTATLTLLTAICLQILSNLANDYGDAANGADNEMRVGPVRVTQSGLITKEQIKKGIVIFMLLSLVCGILLLILSVEHIGYKGAMTLFLLGILSIAAAIAYTATRIPYGYKGFGDLSVFIFFGLLAVSGSYYIQAGNYPVVILIPACGMGFFCTAVLNVNNIRDIEADVRANKKTIAVQLGLRRSKIYHWVLLVAGLACFTGYYYIILQPVLNYLFLLPGALFFINGFGVTKSHTPHDINPYLKQLVISILIFTLSAGAGLAV